MATINVSSEEVDFTSISNVFIEHYMTDANGDFVKLYLYLAMLSAMKKPITVRDIADHLNCTESDVCRGIKYWIKEDAISLSYNDSGEVTGIVLLNLKRPVTDLNDLKIVDFSLALPSNKSETEADKEESVEEAVAEAMPKAPRKKQPTPKQLTSYMRDPEIEDLVQEATAYCQHQLTQKDINSIIYIKDQLGFSFDLAEYLLEYCAEVKKTSFNYIEKVARNWYEEGIDNRDDAEEYSARYLTFYSKIMKAMGITSRFSPVPVEKKYIDRWTNDFGFTENIILEACNRAISQKPNDVTFPYVNGILENWHNNNVHTFSDISKLDELHSEKKKKSNNNQGINKQGIIPSAGSSDKLKMLEDYFLDEVK